MNKYYLSKGYRAWYFCVFIVFFLFLLFIRVRCYAMDEPPCYIFNDAWERYRQNWYVVSLEQADSSYDFHSRLGTVIAQTKLRAKDPDAADNIAAFGFTLRSGNDGTPIRTVAMLPVISSTIDQIGQPIVASDGRSIVTVRDLIGENVLHGEYRAHRVLEMAEWLVPWTYTEHWGMLGIIEYERDLIRESQESPSPSILNWLTVLKPIDARVHRGSTGFESITPGKAAGDVFHCEQVVVYKMLTDSEFLASNIAKLMEGEVPDKICLDFDIVTFNDMCPKCFSTIFHRFEEIRLKVSDQIIRYFQQSSRAELLYKKLPITFRVIVSSYRPYKIETLDRSVNLKTRQCAECEAATALACPLIKAIISKHSPIGGTNEGFIPLRNGIFQFVNPWVEESFSELRAKYEEILRKKEELERKRERLVQLLNPGDLPTRIQAFIQTKINPSLSTVKKLLAFDLKEARSLLEEEPAQ